MENKLDPDFKTKWVAALRSGEYKQGRHTLIDTDGGYCCLAVAGKVLGYSDKEIKVSGYYNIPDPIKGGFSNPTAEHLMYLNDEKKKSFIEIADYIEENL